MPSPISAHQYGSVVLEHIREGLFPETEDLVSSKLPPSALPEALKIIEQARAELKVGRWPCYFVHF